MDRYSIVLKKKPPRKKRERHPISFEESPPKEITSDQRESLVSHYLSNQQGRQALAQSMVNPLRQRLNYSSLARRCFQVDPLPNGALPIYDKSSGDSTFVLRSTVHNLISPYQVPLRYKNFEVPMHAIFVNSSRFNALIGDLYSSIRRMQDIVVSRLIMQERDLAVSLLRSAGKRIRTSNIAQGIERSFTSIENNNLHVGNVLMNTREYSILRRNRGMGLLNQISRRGILDNQVPRILGATLIVSSVVFPGEIYVLSEPQYLGRLSTRELVPVIQSTIGERELGLRFLGLELTEEIGYYCNSNAVVRIDLR